MIFGGVTRWCFLLATATLSFAALADEGDDDAHVVYYMCNVQHSSITVTAPAYADKDAVGDASVYSQTTERIDAGNLVTYSKEDARGNVLRTGSRTITRQCGNLSVQFSGGYFNPNPMGEMGAADDYAIVTVQVGGQRIAGPVAMGECTLDSARYSYMAQCPKDWAVELSVSSDDGGQSHHLYLKRVNDEYRDL